MLSNDKTGTGQWHLVSLWAPVLEPDLDWSDRLTYFVWLFLPISSSYVLCQWRFNDKLNLFMNVLAQNAILHMESVKKSSSFIEVEFFQ